MLAKYKLQIIDNFKLTESMKKALAKIYLHAYAWKADCYLLTKDLFLLHYAV